MGCCRGRQKRRLAGQQISSQCKEVERRGANLRIFPVRTTAGNLLFVLQLDGTQRMEVESYLRAHGCDGPVSTNLLTRVARLSQAAQARPEAFLRFTRTGIPLSDLLRI